MRALVDTNVVLRHALASERLHVAARKGLERLTRQGWELCICSQNIFEFWVVATGPGEVNGLDLAPEQAAAEVAVLRETYVVLGEPEDGLARWLDLCRRYGVRDRAAHDARIAAVMLAHGIHHIVTFNTADFARYGELNVVDPSAVDGPRSTADSP